MSTQDLVPGINPLELVQARDEILAAVRQGVDTLIRANHQAEAAGFGVIWNDLVPIVNHFTCEKDRLTMIDAGFKRFGEQLDTRGWDHLLAASGLRSFMDTEARKEWDEAIKKNDTPPLDAGSIEATFRAIHADRGHMVERGVLGVFRRLTWNYKTNQPGLFGKKIIVRRFLDHYGFIEHDAGGIEDLIRTFCVYDGQPEPDHRSSIASSSILVAGQWSNDYLDLKWFKNGNAHATFKRPDLVDKLNAVVAKHYPGALPAPR